MDANAHNDRCLIITRVLGASPAEAFAAWRDPAALARWWGPNGFTITTHQLDFRKGGTWHFTMHGADGHDYVNRIEDVEVEENRSIVYRHRGQADDRAVSFEVRVTFAALGDKTLLTFASEFPSAEDLAWVENEHGASSGMLETTARLAAHVDSARRGDRHGGWHFGLAPHAAWQDVGPGQRIRILADCASTAVLLSEVTPGFVGPRHVHPGPEALYVLSGTVVSEGQTLAAGDAYLAEANTEHREMRSDDGATFVVVYGKQSTR